MDTSLNVSIPGDIAFVVSTTSSAAGTFVHVTWVDAERTASEEIDGEFIEHDFIPAVRRLMASLDPTLRD